MLTAAIATVTAPRAAPSAEDADRNAYNAAFSELEFSWRWDASTYRDLLRIPEEKGRISAYLERHQAHLLKAYDPSFLSELIYRTKCRWMEEHRPH